MAIIYCVWRVVILVWCGVVGCTAQYHQGTPVRGTAAVVACKPPPPELRREDGTVVITNNNNSNNSTMTEEAGLNLALQHRSDNRVRKYSSSELTP